MIGRFNFSSVAKRRENERANKLFFSFDIYNSHAWTALPLQTVRSLPACINTHSLPLSCSQTTHDSLSTFCLSHQPASSLGCMNASSELTPQLKACFHPGPPSLGDFLRLSCCPQLWAPDKAFLSVRELHNQEHGLDIYGQRNIHVPAPVAS